MSEEKKNVPEAPGERKKKFGLRNIFYHNTFVLIFSFAVALVAWFIMAAASDTERPFTVYDVPIQTKLSSEAEADGLRVFNMSYNAADIEVSGNSLLTSKLTPEDFDVTVTLNPTSTKLTGNTLQKMTVPVKAVKKNSISEYAIASVSPEEINIEFDRYKEVTYTIENELKYSADSGYYAGAPAFSEETVMISGPESSVNKVSRVAVSYTVDNPLKAEETLSCPIRMYDQNNQEISDTSGMYLSLSVDTVDVTIPVMQKKTVSLAANTVHQPKGFGSSRIVVEPAQIDIAGPQEVLSGISEIQLDTVIDFADLDITQKNVFTVDIPLPTGVRNISSAGENTVSQATVTINLNGYKQTKVTVPEDNIQILNRPAGKEVQLTTKSLEVSLIGSDAQVANLTGDSVSVQADLTNFGDQTGSVSVPVTVAISGSGADSCWVVGKYNVTVTIVEKNVLQANAEGKTSGAVAATPQE